MSTVALILGVLLGLSTLFYAVMFVLTIAVDGYWAILPVFTFYASPGIALLALVGVILAFKSRIHPEYRRRSQIALVLCLIGFVTHTAGSVFLYGFVLPY